MLIFDQSRPGRQAVIPATAPANALSDLPETLRCPLKRQAQTLGVTAMDFAKRLLDLGFHAPTTYFSMLVPECLLIEPTETECKEELDGFVAAMAQIQRKAEADPDWVKGAPHHRPVRRLDEVRAARDMDLAWRPGES